MMGFQVGFVITEDFAKAWDSARPDNRIVIDPHTGNWYAEKEPEKILGKLERGGHLRWVE